MIPKITGGGASFRGAFLYYLHDKGAATSGRVDWTQTENMRTDDPGKAWRIMAYTARAQERLKEASGQSRAGRKLEKPVFAFSLSWHPEQSPTRERMLETARRAIAVLGLSEHEALIVAHRDEPQKHLHVIVNRVHPLTGMAGDVRNSKRKLSDFARLYEQETGKIYCRQRTTNHRKREEGEMSRYSDPNIADAWQTTKTGAAFVKALEAKGYRLAQGRKRLVIIDPHGKAHNPTRHLQGVRARDIEERLRDLDLSRLPDADAPMEAKAPMETKAPGEAEAPEAPSREIRIPRAAPEQDNYRRDLARLVQRHADELAEKHRHTADALVLQQHRVTARAEKRLGKLYQLPQRRQELKTMKRSLMAAPWWKRLLGLTRKDRDAFLEKVREYNRDARACRAEMADLEARNRKARRELKERQSTERQAIAAYAACLQAEERGAEPTRGKEHGPTLQAVYIAAARGSENTKNPEIFRSGRMNDSRDSYQR